MEASSTTVNITGTAPIQVTATQGAALEIKHTHGPNFGRYVADCPKCHELHPDGPPKRSKKLKPSLAEENAALKAQLAELVAAKVGITSGNATDQLVQLMLADQAEKLREKEAEKTRKAMAREADLKAAQQLVAQKSAVQANCELTGHKKENGRSAIFQSQVHNDGMVHPFCSRCFKTFPARRPTQEQMSTSVEG